MANLDHCCPAAGAVGIVRRQRHLDTRQVHWEPLWIASLPMSAKIFSVTPVIASQNENALAYKGL
jgi:hypothetical protein